MRLTSILAGYETKELPLKSFSSARGKVALDNLVSAQCSDGSRQPQFSGMIPVEDGQSVRYRESMLYTVFEYRCADESSLAVDCMCKRLAFIYSSAH
jgi:hypothetical protein